MLIPQGRLPLLCTPQSFLPLQRTGAHLGPLVVPVLRGRPEQVMFSAREGKGGILETARGHRPKRQVIRGHVNPWTEKELGEGTGESEGLGLHLKRSQLQRLLGVM